MSDRELLDEINDNRKYAETEWDDIRGEARKDKLCVAGKPWDAIDPDGKKQRQDTKRPFLSLDELGQYINQTVNDVKANPRGIKFAPTGNGANDQGAEFYQNHTREIEYRSQAPRVAYPTAFEHAVTHGYGWVRIDAEREHMRTFNHNLAIKPVVNAEQILPDPDAVWPDSRDINFLFHLEPWSWPELKRRYPRATRTTFTSEYNRLAPKWRISGQRVEVASYWRIKRIERQLVAYRPKGAQPGQEQVALLHELPGGKLPAGAENIRQEAVDDTRVECYITNGLEILDEVKWAGRYIPYVSCFGKILYLDDGPGGASRRQILSMTRLARDAYMLYCYIRTCEAEAIGGVPRAPFIGYKGQFARPEAWKRAAHEPTAFLEAEVTVPGNPTQSPLPLPQRQSWDPPLQNLELAAEAARRAIQAAMGITPLPTPMQRDNQKSGKALDAITSSGQRGSFHFVDHYDLMIERTGIILEDAIPHYLDSARDVAVRKPDDTAAIVRINDAQAQDPIFTKGDYRVTVSTAPATDSQREDARDVVEALVSNIAVIAQLAGPQRALKIVAQSLRLKQLGPIGDAIIDVLDPPQMGQDGKPIPPELAQLMGENQQLKQLLSQAAQEKQAKVVEQQGKFTIEKYKTDAASADKAADREVKLAIAELTSKIDRLALFLEESRLVGARTHEQHQSLRERAHESMERTKDRIHERMQAEAEHAQALELASQQHQDALEQGDQGIAGQMAVQAAQPEPEAGA